jgi:hypothetical protein
MAPSGRCIRKNMKFQYANPTSNKWETICELECEQCPHVILGNPNGRTARLRNDRQCSRNVCIGRSYCFPNCNKAYGVVVKPSLIPGAGKGLFATKVFKEGNFICPFGGERLEVNPTPPTVPRARPLAKHAYLASSVQVCPSVRPSVRLTVCLSICPSVRLSVCPSIRLSEFLGPAARDPGP